MTLHYHGLPCTPLSVFESLAGKCFCVSYATCSRTTVERAHQLGQSVMLDNGAFSLWRAGKPTDWPGFYRWADEWLECASTWAVPPDVIEGDEAQNDALLLQWPFPRHKARPVWHLHESMERLDRLVDEWPSGVCFGSSGEYAEVGSPSWNNRVQDAFDAIWDRRPWVHMLRGMQCSRMPYPFASVDSTDVSRNHHAAKRGALQGRLMADSWDSIQCPTTYTPRPREAQWIA